MNYFEYMEQKTAPRKLSKRPELAAGYVGPFYSVHAVMDWKESPEMDGVFCSNTGIEIRPATPEEIAQWSQQMEQATRTTWA